ncbi:MAG: endonuclease [Bacteroidota bacterium]
MEKVHITNRFQFLARLHLFTGIHFLYCMAGYQTLPAQHHQHLSENCATADSGQKTGQNVRILFWNVENLFDNRDDTLIADEEFTWNGAMRWTYTKLRIKLSHVAKVILAAGEWDPPAIIGLCEVENRYVLNKLAYNSPLKTLNYRIIHQDSPDQRGIDVAMLYRSDAFIPLITEWISIRFPFDTAVQTREILYVKGLLLQRDTIHLFINHWPSRRGGEAVSAPRRNYVASALRKKVDSIIQSAVCSLQSTDSNHITSSPHHLITSSPNHHITTSPHHHPFIVIMGDFNDEPENESLKTILRARLDTCELKPCDLVNILSMKAGRAGSYKFREHWGLLDQFIVSGSLLDTDNSLHICLSSVQIFNPGFLLEDDLRYLDKKPKRTFLGPRYKGGFSDHLPIIMEIRKLGN